jgi:hypothetical protein
VGQLNVGLNVGERFDGLKVGDLVVGFPEIGLLVGEVGWRVDGFDVGDRVTVGLEVGRRVDGDRVVGLVVGWRVVGLGVLGLEVGFLVVGFLVVGFLVVGFIVFFGQQVPSTVARKMPGEISAADSIIISRTS